MKLCLSSSLPVTPHRRVEYFNMLYIDKLHVLFELSEDLALDMGLFPTLSASKHVSHNAHQGPLSADILSPNSVRGEGRKRQRIFNNQIDVLVIYQSIYLPCLSIYHLIYPIHLSSIYCFYLLFIDSLTFNCHILNVLNSFKTKKHDYYK